MRGPCVLRIPACALTSSPRAVVANTTTPPARLSGHQRDAATMVRLFPPTRRRHVYAATSIWPPPRPTITAARVTARLPPVRRTAAIASCPACFRGACAFVLSWTPNTLRAFVAPQHAALCAAHGQRAGAAISRRPPFRVSPAPGHTASTWAWRRVSLTHTGLPGHPPRCPCRWEGGCFRRHPPRCPCRWGSCWGEVHVLGRQACACGGDTDWFETAHGRYGGTHRAECSVSWPTHGTWFGCGR